MTTCSNPNRDDHWTCPECYADLPAKSEGVHTCPRCKTEALCSVELHPSCHSDSDPEAISEWREFRGEAA